MLVPSGGTQDSEGHKDVWSVSGQEGSLAGHPRGASVHPVGVCSESVLHLTILRCYTQHLHQILTDFRCGKRLFESLVSFYYLLFIYIMWGTKDA